MKIWFMRKKIPKKVIDKLVKVMKSQHPSIVHVIKDTDTGIIYVCTYCVKCRQQSAYLLNDTMLKVPFLLFQCPVCKFQEPIEKEKIEKALSEGYN